MGERTGFPPIRMLESMNWQDKYRDKLVTVKQAAGLVKPDADVLFPVSNHPKEIIMEIARRHGELKEVTLTSHWVEDYPFLHIKDYPEMAGAFLVKDPITVNYSREGVRERTIDWQPTVFGLSNGERQADPNRGRLYHL